MTTRFPRIRVKAAALVLCGAAAIAAAVAASVPATAAGRSQQALIAAPGVPVVIDCAEHPQVRPGQYILACADAGAYLTGLHWPAWGTSSAFAQGFFKLNLCTPNCSAGHFARFPMLAAFWRAEPRPGHAGQSYFTRVTLIYTGNRAYREHGKLFHLPPTATYPLSEFGGAGTP